MEGLLIILGGSGIAGLCFAIWLNTKSGKRWLESF